MSKSTIKDNDLISLALKVPYQYWWNIEDLIDKANSNYTKEKLRWIMRKKELHDQINAN